MKRPIWVLLPVILAAASAQSQVQQLAGAEYTGNRLCLACHKGQDKEIVEAYPHTAHANAMMEATDETVKADFTDAPFERARVAYVLGSGRHEQAYLDAELMVLPGAWDTVNNKWVPQESVDGATECVGCHTTGFNPDTKHWEMMGVGCESCHGPGSVHNKAKKDERLTTIVNPAKLDAKQQAFVCGQCHSKGRSKDNRFAYPPDFLPGMDLDEVFVDQKPQGPGRNQQLSDLRLSPAHWQNGIVCENCHDPHGDTEQPYQLIMPINDTCTQCHEGMKDIAAHVQAKGKTLPEGATCATCHMPEDRHLFDLTLVH